MIIASISTVFILAILVEGLIEYFISTPGVKQPWLKYVSAAIGVALCVLYGVDLLALFGVTTPVPYVGSILTGLVIGRGSNYLNDLITLIRNWAQTRPVQQ